MCAERPALIQLDTLSTKRASDDIESRAEYLLRSGLMQRIIVPLRFPAVAGPYPLFREAFDIILLSKNLPGQDLRHSKLDHDRRDDSMDHHYRVSIDFPMRYKLRRQLGNS